VNIFISAALIIALVVDTFYLRYLDHLPPAQEFAVLMAALAVASPSRQRLATLFAAAVAVAALAAAGCALVAAMLPCIAAIGAGTIFSTIMIVTFACAQISHVCAKHGSIARDTPTLTTTK
jgi:hypothetical protein